MCTYSPTYSIWDSYNGTRRITFDSWKRKPYIYEVIQSRCKHLWTKSDNKNHTVVYVSGTTTCWAVTSSWQPSPIFLLLVLYHIIGCLWVQCTVYFWVLFTNEGCHSNFGHGLLFITFKSSFPQWMWAKNGRVQDKKREKEDTVGGGRVTCKSTESLLQLIVMMLTMSVAAGMTPVRASVLGVVWLVTLWTGPKPSPILTAFSLCCMCGPCQIQMLLHKATVLLEITQSLWKHPTLFAWPLYMAAPSQTLDSASEATAS